MNRNLSFVISTLGALLFVACSAHRPPQELVEANSEYRKAEKGSAASAAPAQLYEARKALDRANKAYEDRRDNEEVRDWAYIALRKAQLAEAQAEIDLANRDVQQAQKVEQQHTRDELGRTKEQLQKSTQEVESERRVLNTEKQARLDAEKRASEAMEHLDRIASVKQERRGMVITIPGSVLFTSRGSTLLPDARNKLDEVAVALRESDGEKVIIEGHTDSRGSDSANQELSLRRAQAVRDYLIDRGVPAEKLRAVGLGKTRPVAENNTPEGRANNRRVEIVVMRLGTPSGG